MKANNISVEVHSVLTVVSSTPVSPAGKTCPLSALDRAMGQHSVHVIFYYRSGSLNFDRVRPALNEVLTLYPNVTGRLAKDGEGNWEVSCTDAGVRVHRAKVGISVDEWLRFATADDEKHLTVWEDLPDDPHFWSPFRIQVTDFEGGGTAIALSCPHMLADPISATLLIKSWTEAYHRDVIGNPPFLYPFSLTKPSKATTKTASTATYYSGKANILDTEPSVKMASATFSFSDATIKRSLSETCSSLPGATPFDLLTALFWTRITRMKAEVHDCKQKISICMDIRKRLHAPLPFGYFGNALYFLELTLDENEMRSQDLGHVAELVHRHVDGVKEDEFWSAVDWLQSRKDDQGKFAAPFRMYGPELTCVNMEHMIAPVGTNANESQPLMYMARFDEDQKPTHVSYHVGNAEGEGLILVMPSSEEGLARSVSVTLPEKEIKKLLEDEVILSLEPTLLLSGRR